MDSSSTRAGPARLSPRPHVNNVGNPEIPQQLVGLDALERQAAEVPSSALRLLMSIEISGAREALHLLRTTRDTSPLRALAERGLEEVGEYVRRREYPEAAGYAKAVAQLVEAGSPSDQRQEERTPNVCKNKNALILIAISFSVVLLVAGIIFMVSLLRSEKATVLHLSEIPTSAWKYMASNAPIAGRQGSEAIDYTRALAGGYGPEWRFLLQVDVAQVTSSPTDRMCSRGSPKSGKWGWSYYYRQAHAP